MEDHLTQQEIEEITRKNLSGTSSYVFVPKVECFMQDIESLSVESYAVYLPISMHKLIHAKLKEELELASFLNWFELAKTIAEEK